MFGCEDTLGLGTALVNTLFSLITCLTSFAQHIFQGQQMLSHPAGSNVQEGQQQVCADDHQ